MAFLQPPVWLENSDQHNAQDYRAMLASLVSGGIAAPGALAVTEAPGTPDMSVRVAAGGVFIRSTRSAAQGIYHAYNDAAVTVVVPAADATNARIDLVVVRVRDEAQDVSLSQNDVVVELVTGTPAATPTEPTISFEDYLVLARINVAASVSAITNSDIVDRRVRSAVVRGGSLYPVVRQVLGTSGDATVTATTPGILATPTAAIVPAQAGDWLNITLSGMWGSSAGLGRLSVGSTDAASTTLFNLMAGNSTSGYLAWRGSASVESPFGGSALYQVQAGDVVDGNVYAKVIAWVSTGSKVLNRTASAPIYLAVTNMGPSR